MYVPSNIFSSDEDEDKYVDKMDMPGTKVDAAERYTVRNLRIREDTAKYLRNLDPNSAYYDPKTRAMRKNPYENTGNFNLPIYTIQLQWKRKSWFSQVFENILFWKFVSKETAKK